VSQHWRQTHYVVTNTEVYIHFSSLETSTIKLKLLTRYAEWSQFTVDYLFR